MLLFHFALSPSTPNGFSSTIYDRSCVVVGFFSEDLARLPHEPLRDLKPKPIGNCGATPEKMSCMGIAARVFYISC